MKRCKLVFFLLLLFTFILIDYRVYAAETSGILLQFNTPVTGNLYKAETNVGQDKNIESYIVNIPKEGILRVTAQGMSADTDGKVTIQQPNSDNYLTYNNFGGTTASTVEYALAPGQYQIKVERNWFWHDTSWQYSVKAEFLEAELDVDKEPNDEIANAVSVEKDSTITGHLGYYNDYNGDGKYEKDNVDFYKITLGEEGTLNIAPSSTSFYPSDISGIVRVFNGQTKSDSDNYISYTSINPTQSGAVERYNLGPGTYYIEVVREWWYKDSFWSYKVQLNFTPSDYKGDNETGLLDLSSSLDKAANIEQSATVTGNLGYYNSDLFKSENKFKDNEDYYKFTVKTKGKVKISTLGSEEKNSISGNIDVMSLSYPLENSAKVSYVKINKENNSTEFDAEPGVYFMKVVREWWTCDTAWSYKIEIVLPNVSNEEDTSGYKIITAKDITDLYHEWTVKFTSPFSTYNDFSENNIYITDNTSGTRVSGIYVHLDNADAKLLKVSAPSSGYVKGHSYTLYIKPAIKNTKDVMLKKGVKMNFQVQ